MDFKTHFFRAHFSFKRLFISRGGHGLKKQKGLRDAVFGDCRSAKSRRFRIEKLKTVFYKKYVK